MPSLDVTVAQLEVLWLLFFAYSMIGWMVESTYCSVPARRFINRGFLNGPYLPIYGTGAMIAALLLSPVGNAAPYGDPSSIGNFLAVFLMGGTLSCAVEYATSYVMEKRYHARWWDYSTRPLNLNGRIWIGGFLEFGGCSLGVVLVNPYVMGPIQSLSQDTRAILTVITLAVFLGDLAITNVGASSLRENIDILRTETAKRLHALREALPSLPEHPYSISLDGVIDDYLRPRLESATQAARDAVSGVSQPAHDLMFVLRQMPVLHDLALSFAARMNAQQRRLIQAFPTARPTDWEPTYEEYQAIIREYAQRIQEIQDRAKE